jgi:hypothetical protein
MNHVLRPLHVERPPLHYVNHKPPFVCYGHGALLVAAGKPLLARHRAVNAAIADEIKKIHAITLKTYTPQQWEDIKAKASA